jgi:hypothetical protein
MRISSLLAVAGVSTITMFAGSAASAASLSPAHSSQSVPQSDGPLVIVAVLCTESNSGGCVAPLPIDTGTTVASDGESAFDPFHFGSDTSDGIALSSIWTKAVATTSWQNIAGTNTWVIPACVNGVCENGAVPERIGHWAAPGFTLVGADRVTYNILEARGALSDQINIFNDQNGVVQLTFNSGVPEAATWLLMLIGFGGLGAMLRARGRVATEAA